MKSKTIKFMKEQKVYDAFCSELKKQKGITFDQLFKKYEGKKKLRYRTIAFSFWWRESFGAKTEVEKKKSFEYWNVFFMNFCEWCNKNDY